MLYGMLCTIEALLLPQITPGNLGREGCAVNLTVRYINTFACLSVWMRGSSAVAHRKLRENLGIDYKIEVVCKEKSWSPKTWDMTLRIKLFQMPNEKNLQQTLTKSISDVAQWGIFNISSCFGSMNHLEIPLDLGITSSNPPAKEPSAFLHEWFSPSAPQKSRFKKCKEIDMWLKKTLLDSGFGFEKHVAVSLGAGSARKIGCHDSYPSETIKYIPHNAWRMEWPPSQLHCMAPPCQKASPLHWPDQRWRRACKSGMFSQLKCPHAVVNSTYIRSDM